MGTTYWRAEAVGSKRLVLLAATALPILLAIPFSSSPVSASPVFLGTATIFDELDGETCFADCDRQSFESFSTGNASVVTPDSAGQSTAVLSQAPSISVRSEADALSGGGGLGTGEFTAGNKAQLTLHYYFAAEGPQNTTVSAHLTANGNISVTGNFASTGYNYLTEARLIFGPVGLSDMFIDNDPRGAQGGTISRSFGIDGTYQLQTNTAYEVLMQIQASAFVTEENPQFTALADLVATASIDPSIQIDAPYANDYSIVFSDGITVTTATTPVPAALPLFATGLGGFAYLARRRSRKRASAA